MENEIKQIISDVSKVAMTEVHEDAELGNDLAIDSLDLLDVVTELEKKISNRYSCRRHDGFYNCKRYYYSSTKHG